MKTVSKLLATLMLGSLLFSACSHKDAPGTITPPPTPALSIDKTTLTQAATAGTATIAVTSNVSWKVTSSASWATVSSATGSNNSNVTVTMTANDGTAVRTADITIAPSESGSSLTPQIIKITQGGSDPFLMVDKTTAAIAGAGGIVDVKVTSNVDWASRTTLIQTSPTPPVPFISGDKANGVAGETTVRYTIAANATVDAQIADVTYTGVGVEPAKTTFTEAVDYKLTSFSPANAVVGSSITLTGLFGPNPVIKINGVQATIFGVASDRKSITCMVPTGASSGKITVEIGGNTYTSATDLIVYQLTSFSPNTLASTDHTTQIIIPGVYDGTLPVVKINGVVAPVTAHSATSITITLPPGATSGKITVSFGGFTLTSATDFTVTNAYSITSFAPTTLASNDQNTPIVVTGVFDANATLVVKINETVATVTAHTATSITIRLPVGATDGKITVSFGGNTYTSTTDFLVTNRWEQVSTGHGRYFSAAESIAFVRGGQVYTGLGLDNSGTTYNQDFKIFDPSLTGTNKWLTNGITISNNMPPRASASCFVLNGVVYIGSGYNGSDLSDWWSYDGTSWTNITSYPTAGKGGLGFVVNGIAYAGDPYDNNSGVLSQFDPTGGGSWTPKVTSTDLIKRYASTFVIGTDIYIVAGEDFTGLTNTTMQLTPSNAQSSQPFDFPQKARDMPAFSLNGLGYAIYNNITYVFSPSTAAWTDSHANLPTNIYGVHNAQVVNGVAYAFTADGIVYKFVP